jgi:signal peptidase
MKRPDHTGDTLLGGALQAAEWMVVALAVGAVLVAVVVPTLFGATPYVVLTGSMSPTMPAGTLVVVKPVGESDIATGDVITFMPKENDPEVVTHRVVGVGFDAGGEAVFRTRGDANPVPDVDMVRGDQVVGEEWYSVPYLGYLTDVLTGWQRAVGVYLVAGALLLYALAMFVGAARDRLRRPREARSG